MSYEIKIIQKPNGKLKPIKILHSKDTIPILEPIAFEQQENIVLITLDASMHVINTRITHIGSGCSSVARNTEILRYAVLDNADGIIIAHNHPGGGLKHSKHDKKFVKYLVKGCKYLDIIFWDSIIVHGKYHRSMRKSYRCDD